MAAEVRLAPATLVQFGSKRGLLLAVDEQAVADVAADFQRAREAVAAPLPALRLGLTAMVEGIDSPETLANHLATRQPHFNWRVGVGGPSLRRPRSSILTLSFPRRAGRPR